jgi:hypothetical protein
MIRHGASSIAPTLRRIAFGALVAAAMASAAMWWAIVGADVARHLPW